MLSLPFYSWPLPLFVGCFRTTWGHEVPAVNLFIDLLGMYPFVSDPRSSCCLDVYHLVNRLPIIKLD